MDAIKAILTRRSTGKYMDKIPDITVNKQQIIRTQTFSRR